MNSRDDIKLTPNLEGPAMTLDHAKALDKIHDKITQGDIRVTVITNDVADLKRRMTGTEVIAYSALNGLEKHTVVCDEHKANDEQRRQDTKERLMSQTKEMTDAIRGVQKAVENQSKSADTKIKAVDEKWGSLKDKVLFSFASGAGATALALAYYIWTLKVGP